MKNGLANLLDDIYDVFNGNNFDFLSELEKYLNCKGEDCKNDSKSYGYYDKKVYKDNELYDHVEKKFEDGKCYSLKHNPNNGVTDELPCCEKKCVENKTECKKECCKGEKDASVMEKIARLENENKKLKEDQKELLSTLDTIRETGQELMAALKLYEEENAQLKEKLNNIKKLF